MMWSEIEQQKNTSTWFTDINLTTKFTFLSHEQLSVPKYSQSHALVWFLSRLTQKDIQSFILMETTRDTVSTAIMKQGDNVVAFRNESLKPFKGTFLFFFAEICFSLSNESFKKEFRLGIRECAREERNECGSLSTASLEESSPANQLI